MAQIMNFKKIEVTGATKAEALTKAPFEIVGDATQAYRNWRKAQTGGVTESDKKQFMIDYLMKKSKSAVTGMPTTGCGFYITIDPAVADTRERPYAIEDVKNDLGARSWGTVFQFVDDATGVTLAETTVDYVPKMEKVKDDNGNEILDEEGKPTYRQVVDEEGNPLLVMKCATKAEAKDLGRELYNPAGQAFKGNLTCYMTKQVVKGQNVAFRMKYAPSVNAHHGTYVCFGVERD